MITLSNAIKRGRLSEFIEQEEKRGIGPVDRQGNFDAAISGWLDSRDQKIEHRVLHLAVVRAESKLLK